MHTTTTLDKTALIQKYVTLDLTRTINDALLTQTSLELMLPGTDRTQQQVLASLGALIAAKAYLWMVAHPEEYLDIIENKRGTVRLGSKDLTQVGYYIDLTVDQFEVHVCVSTIDGTELLRGKGDLSHPL